MHGYFANARDVAAIEAQLRLAIGDAAFDAIPDASPRAAGARARPAGPIQPAGAIAHHRVSIEDHGPAGALTSSAVSSGDAPALACRFTQGERAVLVVIGDEARQHGGCRLHIDAIAARAGVCRSTARNAIREAKRLGLVSVEERRRASLPSLTNVVRRTGVKKMIPTVTSKQHAAENVQKPTSKYRSISRETGCRGQKGRSG